MALNGSEAAIAERRLALIADNGETREIVVRLGKPERSPDRADFSCECQILGRGDGKVRSIYGLDEFQALQLSLGFISIMLRHYREETGGRIYWKEPGDDMGFPEKE